MKYTRYQPEQIQFIKDNYNRLSNAELAQALGVSHPRKVLELARRHAVKWRAENGAPQWRYPKQRPASPNWES